MELQLTLFLYPIRMKHEALYARLCSEHKEGTSLSKTGKNPCSHELQSLVNVTSLCPGFLQRSQQWKWLCIKCLILNVRFTLDQLDKFHPRIQCYESFQYELFLFLLLENIALLQESSSVSSHTPNNGAPHIMVCASLSLLSLLDPPFFPQPHLSFLHISPHFRDVVLLLTVCSIISNLEFIC